MTDGGGCLHLWCGRGPVRFPPPAATPTPDQHVPEEGDRGGRFRQTHGPRTDSSVDHAAGPRSDCSVHTALDASQLARFQRDLIHRIGEHRTRLVIIDVAALGVVDSFAANILSACARIARLRGAELTVVGIQPDVALTMVEVGLTTGAAHTAVDLEDGLDDAAHPRPRPA